MPRLFEDQITQEGRSAVANLIDHIAQPLNQTVGDAAKIWAALQGLLLAYMYYLIREYEKANLIIRSYISDSEEWHGEYSSRVLCGLILLSNNYIGWGKLEESRSVLEHVKFVSERCPSFDDDPLLEGLYGLAVKCQKADDATNEQRAIILSLMALSWCVRYQSDDDVYTQYAPRLKSVFESCGFVEDHWEWLIQSCKHNLHNLVGLISILLEKRIIPSDARPPLTTEMREEVLTSLVQEFPVHNKRYGEYLPRTDRNSLMLRFVCPRCGSQDLRTKMLVAYYPVSTLDGLEVTSETLEFEALHEREDPFEWIGSNHNDGWEFWCHNCHLVPNLEEYEEVKTQEEPLARWLLDNCPQDDGLPVTETGQPKE
jgi:hypothetical protein